MEQSEQQKTIAELETQIERLKALYSQYFMGIEKIPPNILRKNVDRTVWRLRKVRFNNTATRFKFQQLVQRYNSYMQHWARILREIERGTYKRHLQKAAARVGADAAMAAAGNRQLAAMANLESVDAEDKPAPKVWDITDDGVDDAPTPPRAMTVPSGDTPDRPAYRRSQPGTAVHASTASPEDRDEPPPSSSRFRPNPWAARAAERTGPASTREPGIPRTRDSNGGQPASAPLRRPPPPANEQARGNGRAPLPPPRKSPAGANGNPQEQQRRHLYQKYINARQQAGESTRGVSYERLNQSLEREAAKLRKKHGAERHIDFDVTIKNGRAVIRPVVK